MQHLTRWLTRLLDMLPWRHARHSARQQMRARMTFPRGVDRFAVPEVDRTRRQKADTSPLCSTLHEDALPPEPPLLTDPPLSPAAPVPDPAPALSPAFPPASVPKGSAAASAAEGVNEPSTVEVDPARRLSFVRYLVRRGVFNEGFASDSLPAQYRHTQQE